MGLFRRTDFQTEPDWPTTVRSRLSSGRIMSVDSSMWLYRVVPLGPVLDAASPTEGLRTAEPLLQAFGELSDLTHVNVSRRAIARRNYRDVHLLLINLPQPYVPHDSALAPRLAEDFSRRNVERRLLLLGVRLVPKTGSDGSLSSAIESITDSLIQGGRPESDYDRDFAAVDAALARCGLRTPTTSEFRLANAWWNNGRYADTPTLVHTGHMHVFDNNVAVRAANQAGPEDCSGWPYIPGTKAVSFLAVQDFDLPFVPATSRKAQWVPGLLANGCVALSIRGKIEPASVTRDELRRNRKRYMDDIAERAEAGKMERAEEQETLADLESVEAGYSGGNAPPTLTDTSVIACIGGVVDDPDEMSRHVGLVVRSMDNREPAAMSETMLGSPTRSNPHLHDLPITSVAYSGIVSLNRVGDKEGALVGFTERDRQPALLSPSAASRSDAYPIFAVPGSTGSGKALKLDEQVPTPHGWTTMGDLSIGDEVFGRTGEIGRVTAIFDHESLELYDLHLCDGQVITACVDHQWVVSSRDDRSGTPVRWAEQRQQIEALDALASAFDDAHSSNIDELAGLLADVPHNGWGGGEAVRSALDMVGCSPQFEDRWSTKIALKALAVRVAQQVVESRATTGWGERVMTVGDMLAEGVRRSDGGVDHPNFSIALSEPVQMPDADLPQDPWTFGASLAAASTDRSQIPPCYLRGSVEQRLALLQGLMDTAGGVDSSLRCELELPDGRLVPDVLELVRSLGIKANVPDDTDQAHPRIRFATSMPVFSRPDNLEFLPGEVADADKALYIDKIVPAPSAPGRCITVDTSDHTYLCAEFVPTHNTAAGLYLASQFTELGVPVVFVDPKTTSSSHDAVVDAFGGQVASLDNLSTADGVFDPLRFSKTPEQGIEMASSLLMQVNPWGSEDRRLNMETPLVHALRVGVSNGAECIGDALRTAQSQGAASPELVKPIFDLADALPMFRACVGMEPGTAPLSVSNTITLIKTGTAHLDLPEAGAPPQSQTQRISLALVRMMVFGAASALADRGTQGGVLMLDEAWVMLAAGRSEIDRLGRLARSWNVMPMLFTQKVTDFLEAGLQGYISRGLVLPLGDEDQARAAFELFGLEATPERIARNTATATVGGADGEAGAPNWASMRHLRDPHTKETLRGSVAYYCDLSGRAVPVEIDIPGWFIELASTNPDDVARRKALMAAGQTPAVRAPSAHSAS